MSNGPGWIIDQWFHTPEGQEFERHVREDLIPKMESSSASLSLCPDGEGDIKFWIETGAAIMLDKPIIVVAVAGREVPEKLRRAADDVIEAETIEAAAPAIETALLRLLDK